MTFLESHLKTVLVFVQGYLTLIAMLLQLLWTRTWTISTAEAKKMLHYFPTAHLTECNNVLCLPMQVYLVMVRTLGSMFNLYVDFMSYQKCLCIVGSN